MTSAAVDPRRSGRKRGIVILVVAIAATLALLVARPPTPGLKAYYIPSEAMLPTLFVGDRLMVDRAAYRAPDGAALTPARGDVVTLSALGGRTAYIKRVIGLPGERIEVKGGVVLLNGRAVPRRAMPAAAIPIDRNEPCAGPLATYRTMISGKPVCALPRFRETLPNGVSYDTIDLGVGASAGDDYGPIQVPRGAVFLMGDNRDESADSRYPVEEMGLGGPVPIRDMIGRAEVVTYSYDGSGSRWNPLSWYNGLRPDRSGISLRPVHDRS